MLPQVLRFVLLAYNELLEDGGFISMITFRFPLDRIPEPWYNAPAYFKGSGVGNPKFHRTVLRT